MMNATYLSPIGWIEVRADSEGITDLIFRDSAEAQDSSNDILKECIIQLNAYFHGSLTDFDIPISLTGTPFQLKVWSELRKIPFGQVITYQNLALRMGGKEFTRSVGLANARNPVSIIIPCHRVIGVKGALTGYGGGIWRKKFLLEHEQRSGPMGFNPTFF